MFHPHFFHTGMFPFHTPGAIADAMGHVSACNVEHDLQRAGKEARNSNARPMLNAFLSTSEWS